MATKKTLADIKKCPIDYLYLWASDEFIAQLGSKANIIKKKRYYQYQALYKAVIDNVSKESEVENTYNQWTGEIAAAIKSTYGFTPGEILVRLALGQQVAGKDFKEGIFGVGEAENVVTDFVDDSGASVDSVSGRISINGKLVATQTPIYGSDGSVTGYSALHKGKQYQSTKIGDQFGVLAYSDANGVYSATGSLLSNESCTFWQNANNYLPMIEQILNWVTSLISSFFPNRTELTPQNTVPVQTEWVEVESDNTGLLVAGGVALAGVLLLTMKNPFKKKVKK